MARTPPETLYTAALPTPLGEARVVFDRDGVLCAFDWTSHEARMRRLLRRHHGPAQPETAAAPPAVRQAVADYFDGQVEALARLAWRTNGTAFQQAVWRALCEIPAGRTESYGQLAARIGAPKAVRAVGLANGANPIGLVVPCHRVIGADGSLTGYGGGMERKRWLLAHEGVALRQAA
ncbi:MAG: methylated-DNA--[protein]-cysteine S-methyltransferase [Pseudomonadota bacterium]